MVRKKFAVLLFTGHVGSSWLASLISSHPEIARIGFEPVDEFTNFNSDFGSAIEQIAETESTDFLSEPERKAISKRHQKYSGETFTGDKLWYFIKTRPYLIKQERFFRITLPQHSKIIILLRRRNKIKNAISQFKRTQLGISHLNQFESAQQKRASIKVDTGYILNQAQNFVHREIVAEHIFRKYRDVFSITGIELLYEDLLTKGAEADACNNIFDAMGLPPHPTVSEYKKMTLDDLRVAISNYDELACKLKDTIFYRCLSDDSFDVTKELIGGKIDSSSIWPSQELAAVDKFFA